MQFSSNLAVNQAIKLFSYENPEPVDPDRSEIDKRLWKHDMPGWQGLVGLLLRRHVNG